MPVMGALVGSLCHGFFIRRCWTLYGKPRWLLCIVALPVLYPLAAGPFITFRMAQLNPSAVVS
jgi:hypothetical protein